MPDTAFGSATVVLDSIPTAASEAPSDSPTVEPTTSVEAPSGSETTPAAETATATESKESKPAEAATDWRKALDDVDPKELRKHQRFSGILGNEVQRQVQETLAREKAQWAEEQKRLERKRLLDNDPYAYRDEVLAEEQAADQKRAIDAEAEKSWSKIDTDLLHTFHYTLPEAVQDELNGRQYDGDFAESRVAYLKDVVAAQVKHELATARAKWEKDALPALRKQALAELNGGEAAPDLSSGSGAGAVRFTRTQIDNMTPEEYSRNRAAILAQIPSR